METALVEQVAGTHGPSSAGERAGAAGSAQPADAFAQALGQTGVEQAGTSEQGRSSQKAVKVEAEKRSGEPAAGEAAPVEALPAEPFAVAREDGSRGLPQDAAGKDPMPGRPVAVRQEHAVESQVASEPGRVAHAGRKGEKVEAAAGGPAESRHLAPVAPQTPVAPGVPVAPVMPVAPMTPVRPAMPVTPIAPDGLGAASRVAAPPGVDGNAANAVNDSGAIAAGAPARKETVPAAPGAGGGEVPQASGSASAASPLRDSHDAARGLKGPVGAGSVARRSGTGAAAGVERAQGVERCDALHGRPEVQAGDAHGGVAVGSAQAAGTHPGLHPAARGAVALTMASQGAPATAGKDTAGVTERHGEARMPHESAGLAATAAPGDPVTLVSAPRALEIGMTSGTHGWLRVRAELSQEGGVNATVIAANADTAAALGHSAGAMSSFLEQQQVGVERLTFSAGAEGRETAAGGAGMGQAGGSGSQDRPAAGHGPGTGPGPGTTRVRERGFDEPGSSQVYAYGAQGFAYGAQSFAYGAGLETAGAGRGDGWISVRV